MVMLKVENLSKKFKDLEVLKDISLEVNQGEVVAIIGPSGSGKSTLLRCLNQFEQITSGKVTICGDDMIVGQGKNEAIYAPKQILKKIRLNVGMVFQNFNLIPRANALKNVTLPLMYSEHRPKNAKEIGMQMLELVGMADRATHRPNELSGGQKQRIAIARAMINDPSIILADEPTGALDSQTGHMIMDIFHKLHEEQGKTVVLITHSKELAAETERIVTLNDGMIVSDSRKTEKGCDLSGYHKMNDGCNKPEIGEGGTLC